MASANGDVSIERHMTDSVATLPVPLRSLVAGRSWTRVTIGRSRAHTFRLDRAGQRLLYLKISSRSHWGELLYEKDRLEWLQGKLPVPEVICHEANDRNEYLLLSALPGRNAASLVGDMPVTNIVQSLAIGLRMVHAVPIAGCPFDATLDRALEGCRYNVSHGLVNETDFDAIRLGRSAEELFAELVSSRPAGEDLVFTHGDYCLPNVMIDGDNIAGFVDWSRAGVADRFRDIALVIRSLESNSGLPKGTSQIAASTCWRSECRAQARPTRCAPSATGWSSQAVLCGSSPHTAWCRTCSRRSGIWSCHGCSGSWTTSTCW